MFDKIILSLIASIVLLGVAMINIPVPVLWTMGLVTFLGLSMSFRNPYRG